MNLFSKLLSYLLLIDSGDSIQHAGMLDLTKGSNDRSLDLNGYKSLPLSH